jgi:8-amino-7-oxononanoate synthase
MPSENKNQFVDEMNAALAGLRERNQLRSLAQLAGVNLCSNDYLGLAEDPRLKQAVVEAVEKSERIGGTGSRLLSGHDPVWNELEGEFAEFAGTEAALYFANGYAANVGLLSSVIGKSDLVFSDAANHASLIDGIRLSGARKVIYPHLDLNFLEHSLRIHQNETCGKLVVTESVFSMDGDVAKIAAMHKLASRYGASLIVDEAHATAVQGPGGAGIVAEAGLAEEVLAVVHTCGKALASAGAFVCGSRVLREFLINHARTLIFSTAMPPYMAGQIRAALEMAQGMDAERKMLLDNSMATAWANFNAGFVSTNPATRQPAGAISLERHSQIIPVIIGSNEDALAAAKFLQEQGFAVRAIRPPTVPAGTARLRLSLTTRITKENLLSLGTALRAWRESKVMYATVGSA